MHEALFTRTERSHSKADDAAGEQVGAGIGEGEWDRGTDALYLAKKS